MVSSEVGDSIGFYFFFLLSYFLREIVGETHFYMYTHMEVCLPLPGPVLGILEVI